MWNDSEFNFVKFNILCFYTCISFSCYPQNGVSSLLLAAANGHDDVIQSLLQHRATVDLNGNVSAKLILKRSNLININLGYIHIFFKIFEKKFFLRNFCILMIIVLSFHSLFPPGWSNTFDVCSSKWAQ